MLGCVDDLIDVDGFVLVVFFAQDGIDSLADKPTELLFDRDSRDFGFETTLLAAGADDFVVEEGNVAELAGEAVVAVERKKKADAEEKLTAIRAALAALK